MDNGPWHLGPITPNLKKFPVKILPSQDWGGWTSWKHNASMLMKLSVILYWEIIILIIENQKHACGEQGRRSRRCSLVLVVVLMLGEAAELQGVQLLGDLLRPATVDQLPQLERSPARLKPHALRTSTTLKNGEVLNLGRCNWMRWFIIFSAGWI